MCRKIYCKKRTNHQSSIWGNSGTVTLVQAEKLKYLNQLDEKKSNTMARRATKGVKTKNQVECYLKRTHCLMDLSPALFK